MRRGGARAGLPAALAVCLLLVGTAQAHAASEPIFAWTPAPPSQGRPEFGPDGYLNGPCGLAVDATGDLYVADRYHGDIDVFRPAVEGETPEYVAQLSGLGEPCGLAVDSTGRLYVGAFHGVVTRYAPSAFPVTASTHYGSPVQIDPGPATGVAVDPATGDVYVDRRSYLAEYDAGGSFVRRFGEGTLSDGYGLAVSGYPATRGYLYVTDAASDTVEVYDPTEPTEPVQVIDGSAIPGGGFSSLRDSAIAVDASSGEVFVLDDLQPAHAEQPEAAVQVFSSPGAYEGHLRYEVVDGSPGGLAVDDSLQFTRGRVYATSGNTHPGGLYAYAPGAASGGPLEAPTIPPAPLGGSSIFPTVPIGGGALSGGGIACQGDSCQVLPTEPVDPTLATTLAGLGNPTVRYVRRRRRHREKRHRRHRRKSKPRHGARASSSVLPSPASRPTVPAASGAAGVGGASGTAAGATGLGVASGPGFAVAPVPIGTGFQASAWGADGEAASLAGSHPYELELTLGLEQGGGEADLREAQIGLPEGLLADPAAAALCSPTAFSGGNCPASSQVGTLDVESPLGGGRFGLFDLEPAEGFAIELGAYPFGGQVSFGGRIGATGEGVALTLSAAEVPAALRTRGLRIALWGVPWDASHNGERGACLDTSEPSFAVGGCSVGDPFLNSQSRPPAFLTMPTACGSSLTLTARARSWQGGELSATAQATVSGLGPVPITGCESLRFEPRAEGQLSVRKASSSSGFAFRLTGEDPGLVNPRSRISSHVGTVRLDLPDGVTLNPSLGAGLEGCRLARYAAEGPFVPYGGQGCPDGSKIGDFRVRLPFYKGLLEGAVYLAQPYRNPFGSLLAIYLVAKSADRGVSVKVAGKVDADPSTGDLTATFEGLPQLPYEELEVNLRPGQRAPLVSPPSCGAATTGIALIPSAQGVATVNDLSSSPIEAGIEGGPCPGGGAPPFSPHVKAGAINSAGGAWTPYFVHLQRADTEAEITSYSLVLPRGITARLADVPFCPDAAIEAARHGSGAAEAADPSCPSASQVGRTVSGYGVGAALSYAEGRIYMAGPYHGAPLSLVTINPVTIGPFDLGTIVVRSAFDLDPHTAQLRIDAAASDPIPHILDGVVLHLRDIRIYMDRHEFTHNPTSCEPSRLESTLTGSASPFTDPHEATATAGSFFQLLDCRELAFRPKLGLRLRGGTRRGAFPSLRATFAARPGDADLKRIAVAMPHAEFLAQGHIRAICTQPRFAAETCPPGSVYGKAVAYTPLLSAPLRGDVYLRSSQGKLPDLVADLHSGSIRVDLEGRIGPSKQGGILAYFDELPDAPIERFTLTLRGGRHGLLTNSVDICAHPPTATVQALGQNNSGTTFSSVLRGQCKKKASDRNGSHGRRKGGARHHGKQGGRR